MKITVTFDSLEEFQQYFQKQQEPAGAAEAPKPEKKPEPAPVEPQEPAGAAEVPFTEDKKEEPKVAVEEVRKLLADLNKKAGKNVAKDLVKAAGYKKLTDVPAEKLPELKAAAEKEAETYA